jgi:DNA-binding transcriptional regulator YdaS (Cro superfamily)
MDLDEYLSAPGAPSVSQLRKRMEELGYPIKSNAQLRQWRHKYSGRVPSPENCIGLEKATDGKVCRDDSRPDDWWRIWPEWKSVGDREAAANRATDDAQPPTGGRSDRARRAKPAVKRDHREGR